MRVHSVDKRMVSSVMIIAAFVLSTTAALSAAMLSGTLGTWVSGEPPTAHSAQLRALALTAHDPIYIVGDSGFTNASGVVWGSGTESDPFIIEGWEISDGAGDMGIYVQGTTAAFVIRSCSVHDTGPMGTGIYLDECSGCKLINNSCWGNVVGMFLTSLTNSTVSNNTCSGNEYGIEIVQCSNCTLSFNDCWTNSQSGIYVTESTGATLNGNNCSSNGNCGMYLFSSSNNTLSNNICTSDSYASLLLFSSNNNTVTNNNCSYTDSYGICLFLSDGVNLSNNTCMADGYGVYLYSSNDNAVDGNFFSGIWYGIWLDSSERNMLGNNSCLGSSRGLYLYSSGNNTIINNTCSGNNVGIYLENADCNIMRYNTVMDSASYGIFIGTADCSGNWIWNNSLMQNNGATGAYSPAHVQACDLGSGNHWNSTDGYGNYWSDWTSPDSEPDGIVDDPYLLDGSPGVQDNYPLTTAPEIPEFPTMPLIAMLLLVIIALASVARRKKP